MELWLPRFKYVEEETLYEDEHSCPKGIVFYRYKRRGPSLSLVVPEEDPYFGIKDVRVVGSYSGVDDFYKYSDCGENVDREVPVAATEFPFRSVYYLPGGIRLDVAYYPASNNR